MIADDARDGAGLGQLIVLAVTALANWQTGRQRDRLLRELERLAARADAAERLGWAAHAWEVPDRLRSPAEVERMDAEFWAALEAWRGLAVYPSGADGARDGAGGWMVLDTAPGHGGKLTAVLRAGGPICKWTRDGATGLFLFTECGQRTVTWIDIPGEFCPWCGWPRAVSGAGKGATDG